MGEGRGVMDYYCESLDPIYFRVLSLMMIAIISVMREERRDFAVPALWLSAMDRVTLIGMMRIADACHRIHR